MLIVSRVIHIRTAFQLSKFICESEIFHIFLNFVTFHTFLLSQTFVFTNTVKNFSCFQKRSEYLKNITFTMFRKFKIFITLYFNSNVRYSQNRKSV
jgi:hypothetical protein